MDSVISFPVVGRYREDAEMGYIIEDEEHDALELCPLEASPLYMNLRKRMDFATGIVGGRKRRISWSEICDWMHRDSARGRKAVTFTVSKARRLVTQMEKHGLLENRTDREEDRLMFFLPLAKSDFTDAQKRALPEFHQEIADTIAQTANCVSIQHLHKREATTGQFMTSMLLDSEELPLLQDTVQTYSSTVENPAQTRQTFDSPELPKGDKGEPTVTAQNIYTSSAQDEDTRQTSDRETEAKPDNNNPFTPLSAGNKQYTNTQQRAGARVGDVREGKPLSPKVQQAVQAALQTSTLPSGPQSLQDRLVHGMETLVYDQDSGFSLQISPGVRRRSPELARRLEVFVASTFGGEGKA